MQNLDPQKNNSHKIANQKLAGLPSPGNCHIEFSGHGKGA
jgi:hypothetical protein